MSERSREGFYALWTIAIILCLAACLVVLLYTSIIGGGRKTEADAAPDQSAADAADASAESVQTPEPTETPAAAAPVTLAQSDDQGPAYIAQMVFLGDSTTYGMMYYGVLPSTQVWTPESGTLTLNNEATAYIEYYSDDSGEAQSMLIRNAATLRQPDYLVITLGVNGISFLSEEEFKGYYTDLITTVLSVSPNTRIICQSIFPVVDSLASEGISNSAINTANGWVLDVATATGTRYLNTHDALTDDTGNLRTEYSNGDGIHLNADGGNAVLQYIRTHAYQ